MYTSEFNSYHNVILLSDLDFVALDNEHIYMMRWNQTRLSNRRDGSIIMSPAQKYISYGLGCGSVYNNLI